MDRLKVLLIDDEKEFVSTLTERLHLRGIDAQAVYNGEDGLSVMEAYSPQVVVLDVMMPGMSGTEVLQRIKAQYPQIPVILLTGQGTTRDGIEGMRLGAFDYLMKPIVLEELMEKMREAVKSAQKEEKEDAE